MEGLPDDTKEMKCMRQRQCHRGCDIEGVDRTRQCVEQFLYRHEKNVSGKKNLMDIAACSFAQGALKNGRY
jgi:hypothetical protein